MAVVRLEAAALEALFAALQRRGYTVVGPTLRDGAIVYDELERASALPRGWTEVHEAGSYRVARRDDAARFGYAVGPHAWKRWLHPPVLRLWRAERTDDGAFATVDEPVDAPRYAFVGVRPCDVAAIAIQDRVFMGGGHVDADYARRREAAFIVAVQCTEPGGTCFCASMGTGPTATTGYDLALTEVVVAGEPHYLAEAGTAGGSAVLAELCGRPAAVAESAEGERLRAAAAGRMGRALDAAGVAEALHVALEHPRWEATSARCLACGNCTLACPTCFCTTVEDTTDLTGAFADRTRRWDSCFTLDLSYIHGGPVRTSLKSRYRQWATHKLATWRDQFGTSGCVGCGRCITWCPAAIDLTVEATAIAVATAAAAPSAPRSTRPATSSGKERSHAGVAR
jgi:sulfhydrogenase subunit beta (sulfur reductase)